MSKLNTKQISERARKIISERSGGIRYSELVKQISGESPETPINTINGAVWDLATRFPKEISKPSRGLFQPAAGVAISFEVEESSGQKSVEKYPRPIFMSLLPNGLRMI
ncbi:MAG: hypothetical protein HKL96_08645 [Phycisphaerales bacterium]|nr:hypothetical protein [Phycisphaerales bacterium]